MNDAFFTIVDVFATPEGTVLCGVSPGLDPLEDAEIAALINGLIAVDLPTGRSIHRVTKVKSTVSLVGKKNVYLLLPDEEVNPTWLGCCAYR